MMPAAERSLLPSGIHSREAEIDDAAERGQEIR
jgi:hypothetical protein